MEGKIKIGDNYYPTPPQGKTELQQFSKSVFRIGTWVDTGALITLGANYTTPVLIVSAGSKKIITINWVNIKCQFIDSGAGRYNVSEAVVYGFNNLINLDQNVLNIFTNSYNTQPLNLDMSLNDLNQISMYAGIDGGDVERLTGITPGAGDTVQFHVNICYS